MNHPKIKLSEKAKKSKGQSFIIEQSDEIYKWVEDNDINYKLFQSIIRNGTNTTASVIKEYNKQANNKYDMTTEVFNYIIYLINTNQNTYYGIGPFIEVNNIWNILTKDNYYRKHFTITNNASTQTN